MAILSCAEDVQQKFIPCNDCHMYLRMTEEELKTWIHEELGQEDIYDDNIAVTCVNCVENGNLKQENKNLITDLKYLNERVSNLRSIRENENEIDVSMDHLITQFDELNVSKNNRRSTLVEDVAQNITIREDSHDDEEKITDETSIWEDDLFDEVLNGLNNEGSAQQENKEQCNTQQSNTDNESEASTTPDSTLPAEETTINTDEEEPPATITNTEETLPEIESSQANSNEENTSGPTDTVTIKSGMPRNFEKGNHVKTLILGDGVVRNLLFVDKVMRKGEYFRIANPIATLDELIDNALFFMNAFLFNVSNIILQVSYAAVSRGKTEKMKTKLANFILNMNAKDINVTICGPIPYRWMSNEAFSRAYSMIKWLITEHRQGSGKFTLVDSFDLLWNNEYAFNKIGVRELTSFGNWLIEEAITECVVLSD